MPILRNAKHEAMAAALADGLSQEKAYIKAGFKPKNARSGATKLLQQNPNIIQRRNELLAEREAMRSQAVVEAAKKEQVTQEWVLSQLKVVAKRCLQSEPVLDRRGMPVVIEVQDESGAAHAAVAYTFNAMGANRSLELLGKEIGMFVEHKELGKPGDFSRSREELKTSITERATKLGVVKVIPIKKTA